MRKQRHQGDHECRRDAHSNNLDVGVAIGSEQGRVHEVALLFQWWKDHLIRRVGFDVDQLPA